MVSQDSRDSGTVSMDDVEGRVLFRFWPFSTARPSQSS
jgi:hypothetical protein